MLPGVLFALFVAVLLRPGAPLSPLLLLLQPAPFVLVHACMVLKPALHSHPQPPTAAMRKGSDLNEFKCR